MTPRPVTSAVVTLFSLLLFAAASPLFADSPVLARLTIKVRDGHMADVVRYYANNLRPVLQAAGLHESKQTGRTPIEGYFTRLYGFSSVGEFRAARQAADTGLPRTGPLAARFDSLAEWAYLDLYEAPLPEPVHQSAGAGQHPWRSFDADDGLLRSSLGAGVWQHGDGVIWAGDDGGHWSRFDGRRWQTADLCGVEGRVSRLLHDRHGNNWCLRRSPRDNVPADLIRFDGHTAIVVADSVITRRAVEDHEGVLWAGVRHGRALRIDTESGQPLPDLEHGPFAAGSATDDVAIRALLADRSGRFWAAVWTAGLGERLMSRHNGQIRWFAQAEDGAPDAWVHSAAEDTTGRIWFGTENGLWSYDQERFTRVEWQGTNVIDHWGGRSLLVDRRSDLWFGTSMASGASRLNVDAQSRTTLTTYTTQDGLAGNTATGFLEDTEGGIWVSTNAGASRMEPSLTTFRTADGLFSNEPDILALDDAGRLYFTARADGFSVFDGTTFHTYTDLDLVSGITFAATGDLWISTDFWQSANSCARVRDGRVAYYGRADGLSRQSGSFRGITIIDMDGTLLFNSVPLTRFDGETFHVDSVASVEQDSLVVRAIARRRDGGLWMSGVAGGLYRYDRSVVQRLDTHGELAGADVWQILEDRSGNVWAMTMGRGLVRYDGTDFVTYDTDDGLVSPMVMTGFQDSRGHLWFGTDGGGAIRYDGKSFQTLTREDGLAGNVVRSIIEDLDGNIWFACSGGLTRYVPPPPSQPAVFIDAIVADRRYETPTRASLSSSAELVAFEFHGMSMKTRPGAMVYRYRLVGHDEDWRQTRDERVEYTNLPSGDYTFEVIAVDRDLGYSNAPATLPLRVHPPYAEVALGIALVGALGLVAFQTRRVVRRDRRLVATNAELEAANRQITEATQNKSQFLRRMSHDLRSPMNAIIGYSRLLRRRLHDRIDERDARNLANIETSSHNLLSLINEILDLSRIEAGHVDIDLQPIDVRALADECADSLGSIVPQGVTFQRELDDVGVIQSDADSLRKVIMNLIGNAAKFTESGSITLSLKRHGDMVELAFADTGIGIPANDLPHIFDEFRQVERPGGESAEGTGLGLAIAKKTVELLRGEISATSELGVGTTFTVLLPRKTT